MSATTDETMQVLQWAQKAANKSETVAMFWNKLCSAVREPVGAGASKVHSELRRYGGNTIANSFRGHGVPYSEVAYDVADVLRPFRGEREYEKNDVDSCEKFVLEKMGIKDDDIKLIAKGIDSEGTSKAVKAQLKKAGELGVVGGVGAVIAQQLAKVVARQVLVRIIIGLNLALAAWAIFDIAGPARRVMIPGVAYVAFLRKLYWMNQRGL